MTEALVGRRARFFSRALEWEIVRLKMRLRWLRTAGRRDEATETHLRELRSIALCYRAARGEASEQRA